MGTGDDRAHVRLAELVAALSLGIDLGFGQPIAGVLVISRKTVANHIEHIYTKIWTSTRTAAGLFATQHGLLTDEESVPS
jgi:hypothetical protein